MAGSIEQRLAAAGDRRRRAETERSDSTAALAELAREASEAGKTPTEIAALAGCSRQTVHAWLRQVAA